jgi:hypothetical protein
MPKERLFPFEKQKGKQGNRMFDPDDATALADS